MKRIQQSKPVIPLTPPMTALINELKEIVKNPVVQAAYNDAIANVQPVLPNGKKNPWVGQDVNYFVSFFEDWFTFLPLPPSVEETAESGGLGYIVPFTYFYLNNKTAYYFLNQFKSGKNPDQYTTEIFNWTVKFIKARGDFMDSTESLQQLNYWLEDPAIKIDEFVIPKGGYKSFNDFFIRKFKVQNDSRPVSEKDDPSVMTAPADSEINFIQADLTLTTKLAVKSRQINVGDLLTKKNPQDPQKDEQSKYASRFVGGTAVSCVLMPASYHHYHSPVKGKIVESREIPGIYNGIMDGEHWFNTGNIGESTTDFSIFEDFHRAYYVIETEKYGCVGVIPVGLNTISSLNWATIDGKSTMVEPGQESVPVEKGDELGYFAYGGSLNILLFEPGVLDSMSVLMGQRMGALSEKK